MKKIVKYIPVNPYYNEFIETYIGSSAREIEDIQYETESFRAIEHECLDSIYRTEIVLDETNKL